jgi:hypothetical protein
MDKYFKPIFLDCIHGPSLLKVTKFRPGERKEIIKSCMTPSSINLKMSRYLIALRVPTNSPACCRTFNYNIKSPDTRKEQYYTINHHSITPYNCSMWAYDSTDRVHFRYNMLNQITVIYMCNGSIAGQL